MTHRRGAILALMLVMGLPLVAPLPGCARAAEETGQAVSDDAVAAAAAAETEDAGSEARAEAAVEETTYADQGQPSGCTSDCSGHEAGYQWADDHDITDPDDCGGNSASFIEGCRARAEAYQAALEAEGQ